jgi:hypothetical protein
MSGARLQEHGGTRVRHGVREPQRCAEIEIKNYREARRAKKLGR